MRVFVCTALCLIEVLLCDSSTGSAATLTWVGSSGDWNDPANWNAGKLPGLDDDVMIDVPGDATVTHSVGEHTVRSILCQEALVLSGGALRVLDTIQVNQGLVLSGGLLREARILPAADGRAVIAHGGTLDGVTITGDLDVGQSDSGGRLTVVNGLTLNGTLHIGNPTNRWPGSVQFVGTQTLGGNGTVVFGNADDCQRNPNNLLLITESETTLTLGPGITVRGQNGTIGYHNCISSSPNAGLINQGTIAADVSEGRILINAQPFANQGSAQALSDGTLTLDGTWSNTGSFGVTNGTLNLGGSFSLMGLGRLERSGGSVNLMGTLEGGGGTLTLDQASGFLAMTGGTLRNVTLVLTGESQLVFGNGTLDGVTVVGDVDVGRASAGGMVAVVNGLTLNGTLYLGNPTNGWPGSVRFVGTQTLGGNGTVVFGNADDCQRNPNNLLLITESETTLTLGPGITVRGQNGTIGYHNCVSSSPNVGLINQGTIAADLSDGRILINAQPFANQGHAQALSDGTLTLEGAWSNTGRFGVTNGTLNLGGSFSLMGLGRLERSGGSVNLTSTLEAEGDTLTLDRTSGSLAMAGGTLRNVTLVLTGGAQLVLGNGTLDGVTVIGDVDVGRASPGGTVAVVNGLTLNGTLYVGNPINGWSGSVRFVGTQTLGGNGTVVFGNADDCRGSSVNSLFLGDAETTLTLGPGITVRGQNGTIGFYPCLGTPRNVGLINRGTIAADVIEGRILINAQFFANQGHAQALSNGTLTLGGTWNNTGNFGVTNGTLNLGGTFGQLGPGWLRRSGGLVNLMGILEAGGGTVVLDQTSGSLTMAGGTLRNVTLLLTGGAQLVFGNGTLDGVKVVGDVDVGRASAGGTVAVVNGLTLNGTLYVGNPTNGWSGMVNFAGTQALSGNGTVVFGNADDCQKDPNNLLLITESETTLTLGPGITVRGQNGTIGYHNCISSSKNVGLINQGTIAADVSEGRIVINAQPLTSGGILQAMSGATLSSTVSAANTSKTVRAFVGSTVDFRGSARFDDPGFLASQLGGTVRIGGNLLGNTQSVVPFTPQGSTILDGAGNEVLPQLLEVMSPNVGTRAAAFHGPFAYGTLALANNTYVRLVDESDNSPGAVPEALYVNSLVVPAGCTLDLNGLALYTRAAQLSGAVTGGAIHQIPDSGPLTSATPTSGSVVVAGELDEWTFFGRAGETYALVVDTGSGVVPDPKLNYVEVHLLNPAGGIVAQGTSIVAGQTVTLTDVRVSVDGEYRIHVRAPSDQPSSTGNYQVALWETTPDIAPLVLNQTANGRIENPYSVDHWTFSAGAGQQVQFNLLNTSAPGVAFTLRGPDGWIGFSNLITDSELVNLPADGSYALTATGTEGAYQIAYAFKLIETMQTPLDIGETFTGHFTGSGQAQLFLVTVTNSGPLRILLAGSAAADRIELYAARGGPPTRGTFETSDTAGPGANRDLLIPSALVGTFYVLVYGDHIAEPGPFTIQVSSAELYLTRVAPVRHASNIGFNMTLTGAGFEPGTTVELLSSQGVPAGAATSVSVDSFTQLTATFPPNFAPPGLYSMRLRQADGNSAVLTNAFEMLAEGEPKLHTRLVLPDALGRHGLATLYVECENVGAVSMPAPLIQLRSTDPDGSDQPILTLISTRLSEGFWTTVMPQGFGHSVTLLASGSQPGLLQPGERINVPVYYAGLLQPWDFEDDKVELGLSVIEATDNRPMNWGGMSYGTVEIAYVGQPVQPSGGGASGAVLIQPLVSRAVHTPWVNGVPPDEEMLRRLWLLPIEPDTSKTITARFDEPGVLQLRPESISEAGWSGVVANLRASVGERLGDWVRILGENAQYLARQEQITSNIDDLWRFEFLKASGLGPVPVLDSVTDASMVTPGVGLSLSRAFPSAIPGRYVQGPFGLGWTFSWNLKLTEETNGLAQIGSCCGGTQRRYEPDVRSPGEFFSMPGDPASLRKLGDATFELRGPDGSVTRFAAGGLLEAIEEPNGNRVTATYNAQGRLETLTHTSGASLHVAYNAARRIASIHDSGGRTTRFSYDASGNYLETVTTDDGKVTRYTYQTTGDARVLHALTSIERGGTIQHFEYDERGHLQSTFRANGEQRVRFAYDPAGTVFVSDSLGTNSLFYNESGLLTKVVDPLGHITSSVFDTEFRLKKLILPTGEEQSFDWTKQGNLTRITDELGQTTSFSYRPEFNRLASFTDAKLNTTRYTYDTRGNLVSTIYPNQSAERFANYTDAGLPLSYTNRRSQPLTYEYNAAGQITNQIFADGHAIQFTYDPRGNLASTVDGDKVTTYAYAPDTDGDRLKRVTYPQGRYLDYTYDAFGRRIQMTDQDGFATKYEYDSAGRLWKLRDETDTLLVTYTYDPSGRLSRIDKGNGTFTTYEYDAAGQLLSLKNHRNAAALNSRFDYTYDRRGRRTSMSTLDGDWTYGYDATGQLIRAVFDSVNPEIPDQDLTYEYDALGNRVRTIENGVTNLYVANNLNQYTSVGGTNHLHDADGNLIFDGVNTYEWDQQSRLVRMTGPSGVTEYEYDAFGNRVAAVEDGERTEFILNPARLVNIVAEFDGSGNAKARNRYGLGLLGRDESNGLLDYYSFDGNGSSVELTDAAGSVRHSYAYGPFGSGLHSASGDNNPFRFGGKFGIPTGTAGLVQMGTRPYLGSIGHFVGPDPLRLFGGDANFYRYVGNDTINFVDPAGMFRTKEFLQGTSQIVSGGFTLLLSGAAAYATAGIAAPAIAANAFVGGYSLATGVQNVINSFQDVDTSDSRSGGVFGDFAKLSNNKWVQSAGEIADLGIGLIRPLSLPLYNLPDFVINAPGLLFSYYESGLKLFGLPPNGESQANTANSTDPNEKRGPSGFGMANFLTSSASFPYRIRFENFGPGSTNANGEPFPPEVWASAPAQEIVITDQLSTNLNWASFRFTGAGFGDTILVPEQSAPSFQRILPVTIQDKTFDVHFEISLNRVTGLVRAVFRSIDPQTSLPPDVLTGFLPPEDGTGLGQGFIEYTIAPRADLPTGTEIRNIGLISFDRQHSIATDQVDPLNPAAGTDPARQALVTIDVDLPTSAVSSLPPVVTEETFAVVWSGSDGTAGVADFDIFVSINREPWTLWLTGITNTTASFSGRNGDTYAFYSTARDHVGHLEGPPASADAITIVQLPASFILSIEFLDTDPDVPLIKLTYPVEAAFDYQVQLRVPLDSEDAWQTLPDRPHNSGALTLPAADKPQFFRVQRLNR